MEFWKKYRFMMFLMLVMVVAAGRYMTGIIHVTNNVNGKELPIYSVETEKKQVALTFDAVEGNGDTAQILETLKRHDVHATFFLTGGWAAGLACMKKVQGY